MIAAVLLSPMMLAVSQPVVEVPKTLVYDHHSQTSSGFHDRQAAAILAATLTTSTGTGASGCTFDGNCTDSDKDGDE